MRAAVALLLPLVAWAGAALAQVPEGAGPSSVRPLGRLVSAKPDGERYGYAYAPTIVREGGLLHMFFCSLGRGKPFWDYVRYSVSADGSNWSKPVVALGGVDEQVERAACDPSLVRFQAPADAIPYWYLFYAGNAPGMQTVMFVARAERIEGPYGKWTRRGTWEVDPRDPAIIIAPRNPKQDGAPFYGAGQQSVVVEGGELVGWYTDDTTCESSCPRVFRTRTADPVSWPAGVPTDVAASSVDVKRDGTRGGYLMASIEAPHAAGSSLAIRRSADGLAWTAPETVCDSACLVPFAHNAGIAGDPAGSLLPGPLLAAFGAPARGNAACGVCWGDWDLFGVLVERLDP